MADTEGKTRNRYKGELTLTDVAAEKPITRGGVDLSEFRDLISKSWADGEPVSLGATVPTEALGFTENRLRQAAAELNLGVKVDSFGPDTERGKEAGLGDNQSRIVWQAKQKSQRKTKGNDSATSGSPAELDSASSGIADPVPAGSPAQTGLPKPPSRKR